MTIRFFTNLLIVGLLVAGCGAPNEDTRSVSQWLDAPEGPLAQITVDLANPNSGSIGVTMDLSGLPDGAISFKELGKNKGYIYTNVTFSNGTGCLIGAKAQKSGWELSDGVKNGQLPISYDI